jgi:hypothetical protein
VAVSNTAVKAEYTGNGANKTFAIPGVFYESSQVKVYFIDEATDPFTETLKTEVTHYTVVGANVVFVAAPANGQKVLVTRSSPLTQLIDYLTTGAFEADTHERTVDRLVLILQELDELLSRVPRFQRTTDFTNIPISELEDDKFLQVAAGGGFIKMGDLVGSAEYRANIVGIGNGDTSKVIAFSSAMPNVNYVPICMMFNSTDAGVEFQPITVTDKTVNGFTAKWNAPTSTGNYALAYIAMEMA